MLDLLVPAVTAVAHISLMSLVTRPAQSGRIDWPRIISHWRKTDGRFQASADARRALILRRDAKLVPQRALPTVLLAIHASWRRAQRNTLLMKKALRGRGGQYRLARRHASLMAHTKGRRAIPVLCKNMQARAPIIRTTVILYISICCAALVSLLGRLEVIDAIVRINTFTNTRT